MQRILNSVDIIVVVLYLTISCSLFNRTWEILSFVTSHQKVINGSLSSTTIDVKEIP